MRTGQYDDKVDIYSGQVSFPVVIAKRKGRNGLELSLQINYNSQACYNATTWNLETPTGSLGLGWNLLTDYIFVDLHGSSALLSRSYYIYTDGTLNELVCVGKNPDQSLEYKTIAYQFWKILYYPQQEKWTIIKENGDTFAYGDINCRRNAVQWGVKYRNWLGASSSNDGQESIAVVWNLNSISNRFNDAILYSYQQEVQLTGTAQGRFYTQASYLESITGVNGEIIKLNYKNKDKDEYQEAHINPPSPNAYQDRYETKYLYSVEEISQNRTVLVTHQLEYGFIGSGTLKKRLLSSITDIYQKDRSLPATTFAYFGQESADGVNSATIYNQATGDLYGALKSVTLPEGGTVYFQYQDLEIERSSRNLPITPPIAGGITYSKPRWYFESGYAAVTWLGSNTTIALQIYTWDGRWLKWEYIDIPLTSSAAYDGIAVATNNELFVLYTGSRVYPFYQNRAKFGEWIQPAVPSGTSTVPYYSPGYEDEKVTLTAGTQFCTLIGTSSGVLNRYTFTAAGWTSETPVALDGGSKAVYSLAAKNNFLVVGCCPNSGKNLRLCLYSLDVTGIWQSTEFTESIDLSVITGITLKAEDTFATAQLVMNKGGINTVQYMAFMWDETFSTVQTYTFCQQAYSNDQAIVDLKVKGSLAGIGQKMYRFNGQEWIYFNLSSISYTDQVQVMSLDMGYDEVARIIKTNSTSPYIYDLVKYNVDSEKWEVSDNMHTQQATMGMACKVAVTKNYGSNYVIYCNKIYYEQPDHTWKETFTIPDTLTDLDIPTVQVEQSSYMAYQVQTGTGNVKTVVYPLKNGTVIDSPFGLIEEKIYADSGVSLLGTNAFVSYTGTYDEAGSMTLRRVVTEKCKDTQIVYVVKSIKANNGYNSQVTGFVYDAASATVDAGGYIPRFNKATIIPGATRIAEAINGYTEAYFFNGLTPSEVPSLPYPVDSTTNALDYYSFIEGAGYRSNIWRMGSVSPDTVASGTQFWWVYETPLGKRSKGFYARQRKEKNTMDGVSKNKLMDYSPDTGLIVQVTDENYDLNGKQQQYIQQFTYWWEIYDKSRSMNMLTPVVKTWQKIKQVETGEEITKGIAISTWREDWGHGSGQWAPYKSYRALNATPSEFNNWEVNSPEPEADWLKENTVLSRSKSGQVLEGADMDERKTTFIYTADECRTIASVINGAASGDEFSYLGFELYENTKIWNWSETGASLEDNITTIDYHTGSRCLKLIPGNGKKEGCYKIIQPIDQYKKYVFTLWARVENGFDPSQGNAQVEITYYKAADDTAVESCVIDLSGALKEWKYFSKAIDLMEIRKNKILDPKTVLYFKIFVYNQNRTNYFLVDNFRFSPVEALFSATVYDVSDCKTVARLDNNIQAVQAVYNCFNVPVATCGPLKRVNSLIIGTYSRTLFPRDKFNANYPNITTILGSSCDSFFFDFHNNLEGWELDDENWSIDNGELTYIGTSTDPLGSKATLSKVAYTNFAARVKVIRNKNSLPDVAMGNGDYFVQWIESTKEWKLVKNSDDTLIAVNSDIEFKEEWLYLVVDGFIIFFADGVELFNYKYKYPSPIPENYGKLTLCLTKPGAFDEVVLLQEPQLSVTFRDGFGDAIQTITLEGKEVEGPFKDEYSVINEGVFYDNMGRIQYSRNPSTAQLMIAASQAGAADDNELAPQLLLGNQDTYLFGSDGKPLEQQDYLKLVNSYTTNKYEASPLNRLIEIVLPHVIPDPQHKEDDPERKEEDPKNFTIAIQNGSCASPSVLDADYDNVDSDSKYFVEKTSRVQALTKSNTAITTEKIIIRDMQGRVIKTLYGKNGGQYITQGYDYNLFENKTTIYQPNYYNPPDGSDATIWKEDFEYTFDGLLEKETNSDRGSVTYMYDTANRLRFTQDAESRSQTPQRVVYYKYDSLSRVIETGYIQDANYPWSDQGKLQQKVNVQNFPITDASKNNDPNYAAGNWKAKSDYDLDTDSIDTPYTLGKITRVQINNILEPDITKYKYDAYGNIIKSSHTINEYGSMANDFIYDYNNQNQLKTTIYPEKDSQGNFFKVGYFYDRMGRLVSVGQPIEGTEIFDPSKPLKLPEECYAFYQYDFYGRLVGERINAGTNPYVNNSITRKYSYNDAGYLASIDNDYFNEVLDYFTDGGYDGTRYFNGAIGNTRFLYIPKNSPVPEPYITQYQYDSFNRLTAGVNSLKDAWRLNPCDAPYDDNGNIIRSKLGITLKQYNYVLSEQQKRINNQVRDITSTVNTGIDFEGVTPGTMSSGNWIWGSNNNGPSASGIETAYCHTGTQSLRLAGGSLAHYEYLKFQSYLDPNVICTLSYWIKTDADFSAGIGDAAWFLVIGTASGNVIEKKIGLINQSDAWTQDNVQVDMKALLAGIKEPVGYIELELRNYKRNQDDVGAGPSFFIDDITLSGSATCSSYTYNQNGAIISSPAKNISAITYDPVINLATEVHMTDAQGTKLLFNYGENNQRVYEKCQNSDGSTVFQEKLYLHGLSSYPLVEKTKINGTEKTVCYLYGLNGMLAYLDDGKLYYPLKDHLGSTRLLMDEDKNIINLFDYLPYGQMMRRHGVSSTQYLYTGQEYDAESCLYNYRARLYDADLGRFYQTDPAGQYPSPYTYVGNDPVNYIDPSGKTFQDIRSLFSTLFSFLLDCFKEPEYNVTPEIINMFMSHNKRNIYAYYSCNFEGWNKNNDGGMRDECGMIKDWEKIKNKEKSIETAFGKINNLKHFTQTLSQKYNKQVRYYRDFVGQAGDFFNDDQEYAQFFLSFLTTAMKVSDVIHVNLQGLTDFEIKIASEHSKYVTQGKVPEIFLKDKDKISESIKFGHTLWEIATIINDPTLFDKTVFYEGPDLPVCHFMQEDIRNRFTKREKNKTALVIYRPS